MIDRNVYTAYIADEGRDYFCVDQKVTLKNGDVSVDKKYILENGDKTVSIMNFGPYMKQFSNVTIPWTKDFVTIDAKLEQYAPDAQSGSYSTSIDFGTNPSINTLGPISEEDLSVNYSYTIPSFSADLNLTVNSTSNGKIIWDYQGNTSGTLASFNDIPEVLRTDCSLEQSWVWSASLDDDEIYIFTAPQLIDQASVVVVDKTGTIANTTSNYLYAGLPVVYSADGTPTNIVTDAEILEDYQNSFAQMVTCAPHFKQNWTMSIESNYSIVDANDIAEGLKKTFGNYIWENGSFNTRKPFDAYDIAEEVTAYVKETQAHFANNSSEMISVGRNLGMLTGTYYTIYWIAPNGAKVFKHRVVIR